MTNTTRGLLSLRRAESGEFEVYNLDDFRQRTVARFTHRVDAIDFLRKRDARR